VSWWQPADTVKYNFKGKWVSLPWRKWQDVSVSPEWIRTGGGKLLDPSQLDTLIWKAAFYDRGERRNFPGVHYSNEWE